MVRMPASCSTWVSRPWLKVDSETDRVRKASAQFAGEGHEQRDDLAGHTLAVLVRADKGHETYVGVRVIGQVTIANQAAILDAVPGCDRDSWYPDVMPRRDFASGEVIWSNLMDPKPLRHSWPKPRKSRPASPYRETAESSTSFRLLATAYPDVRRAHTVRQPTPAELSADKPQVDHGTPSDEEPATPENLCSPQ